VIEGGEAVARQIGAQGVDVDGPEVVLVVGGREDVRSSSTSTESSARNGRSRGTVAGRMRGRRRGERRRTRVGARVAASCTATSARGTAGAKKARPRWSSARRRRWTALASERGMRLHGPWCGFGSVQGVGAVPGLLTGGDWMQCSGGGCSCGVLVVAGVFRAVENGALIASEPEWLVRSCWWCAARNPATLVPTSWRRCRGRERGWLHSVLLRCERCD
jgi:hypothetical protein